MFEEEQKVPKWEQSLDEWHQFPKTSDHLKYNLLKLRSMQLEADQFQFI